MTERVRELESLLRTRLGEVVFGVDELLHALTIGLLGRGHVLLEGAPGLGKTLLAKSFAQVLGGSFKRIQGTADLMPTDITGVHVFNTAAGAFEFQPGPLFADVVLVDEVNRAGPKTQSALLEAMEERQVSVDRETFALPPDFLVVATQNPREFEGTYPLPESQLDRFMLAVKVDYPERSAELKVIERYNLPAGAADLASQTSLDDAGVGPALTPLPDGLLDEARREIAGVHLAPELVGYVLDIATATRESGGVGLGLSSRGALALARAARIEAALTGHEYVTPDDVKRVAPWVVEHRLMLSAEAALEGDTPEQVLQRVLGSVDVPH